MPLKIISPFDSNLNLQTGSIAELMAPMSARQFRDIIVMPNLKLPITTAQVAMIHKSELERYVANCNFYMTLCLTELISVQEVEKVAYNPLIIGFKLYSLKDAKKLYHLFEIMERLKVPLMVHAEVFMEEVLRDIVETFPKLRITLKSITTSNAVNFVKDTHDNVVATITAYDLMMETNEHHLALVNAATSGNPKFFAGTNSKNDDSFFTGLHAIELYATAFKKVGRLNKLENFLSVFGRIHYGLEIPKEKIFLYETNFLIPDSIGDEELVPFMSGEVLSWKVQNEFA